MLAAAWSRFWSRSDLEIHGGGHKKDAPLFCKKTGHGVVRMIFEEEFQREIETPQKHKTRSAQGIAGFEIW